MEPIAMRITGQHAETQAAAVRAIVQSGYGSTEVLKLGTRPRPTPGPGEVLVQVQAAGLDRGTWHLMTGRPYLMRIMGFGFRAPKCPVPGLDLAGTVIEVGANVSRFRVGDQVFGIGQGAFAELACAREDKLAHKPAALSFEQAAVLGVSGGAALQSLCDAAKLQAGERVLIIGASGGVGSFAVQLAKAMGAEVTGVCRTQKLEQVRALGADHVIDYTQQDFADGSQRYDVVLDVGGNAPLARLRRALTPTGRLVFVGGEYGDDWSGGFERQLLAFAIAPFTRQRFVMLMAREHYSSLEVLAKHAEAGELRPLIDRSYPLHAVADAIQDLEAGRICGKAVIQVNAPA
jgi:NADPH:quinone reductase-like Zn-dependent oxidoreductase